MLSSIYKMHQIGKEIENFSTDYLLLAGGSDFRAYEVLRKWMQGAHLPKHIIFFDFEERIQGISGDNSYFDYKEFPIQFSQVITCSIKTPSTSLTDLNDALRNVTSESKVAIDISCFTKPFFFYLIKLLQEKYKVSSIDTYYTEPESYIFPEKLFNSYHSSSGPLTVKEIPGFTGTEARNDKRLLIILLGFDGDLSQEISEDVSPSKTILVNGFPGYSPKFKDISMVINERLTSNKDFKLHYARANNPFHVYNLLESIKKENSKAFINVAPLGTKPMALGACLFAIHNPNVRIIYPVPEQYERTTTRSCSNSWKYEIPLFA